MLWYLHLRVYPRNPRLLHICLFFFQEQVIETVLMKYLNSFWNFTNSHHPSTTCPSWLLVNPINPPALPMASSFQLAALASLMLPYLLRAAPTQHQHSTNTAPTQHQHSTNTAPTQHQHPKKVARHRHTGSFFPTLKALAKDWIMWGFSSQQCNH